MTEQKSEIEKDLKKAFDALPSSFVNRFILNVDSTNKEVRLIVSEGFLDNIVYKANLVMSLDSAKSILNSLHSLIKEAESVVEASNNIKH